jgi:hypothetical protein
LKDTPAASQLRQAYLFHTVECAIRERELGRAVVLLRKAGIEPLLAKGWALSRLYPEKGLRPYGDIDLCVRPEQYDKASQLLSAPDSQVYMVDLHKGLADLDDRALDDLYDRSQLLKLDGQDIRILSPEDHLRFLCLHLMRHGVWAPIWLCDVSLLLESLPPHFDWDYFLSGDKRRSDWAACALIMAHRLLGAAMTNVPGPLKAKRLPRWLIPSVIKQWGSLHHSDLWPFVSYLKRPHQLITAFRERWPSPIEATVALKAPFNGLPRFPFQLVHVTQRVVTLPLRAMRMLGGSLKHRVHYVKVSMKGGL